MLLWMCLSMLQNNGNVCTGIYFANAEDWASAQAGRARIIVWLQSVRFVTFGLTYAVPFAYVCTTRFGHLPGLVLNRYTARLPGTFECPPGMRDAAAQLSSHTNPATTALLDACWGLSGTHVSC